MLRIWCTCSARDGAQMERQLEADIDQGTQALVQYVASADGLQTVGR